MAGEVVLPPVQMELFAEAGAIVAERAVADGAPREVVAGILLRAAEQAGHACQASPEDMGRPPSDQVAGRAPHPHSASSCALLETNSEP